MSMFVNKNGGEFLKMDSIQINWCFNLNDLAYALVQLSLANLISRKKYYKRAVNVFCDKQGAALNYNSLRNSYKEYRDCKHMGEIHSIIKEVKSLTKDPKEDV